MAVHSGEASLRAHDYHGSAVNRCARLREVKHGGQLLLSQATCGLTRVSLPSKAALLRPGWHPLPDLATPGHISQLTRPDLPAEFPPVRSLDTRLYNLPIQLTASLDERGSWRKCGCSE